MAIALYGYILALPFIFLYGMPIYAGLKHFGCANYYSAIIFGATPGIAWISWTHGSWLDPILWNGILIAFFLYHDTFA
ncbi:hypothetical protein [Deefgea sp. CFH1-16]|uniref:hypothetical protein n=1 Tax=Deefgea sp. CFH1-16 TaxID=2675457 RepID=UPI0015F38B57|nr:hypothetical protein [Deefgea sp. CFH1-16]MBM5573686.1 hypothetical protein [Deefgea sp. CFH1-16]